MLVLEFKAYAKAAQFSAIDEAIRTTQFIRKKAIQLWMDGEAESWYNSLGTVLYEPKNLTLHIS